MANIHITRKQETENKLMEEIDGLSDTVGLDFIHPCGNLQTRVYIDSITAFV